MEFFRCAAQQFVAAGAVDQKIRWTPQAANRFVALADPDRIQHVAMKRFGGPSRMEAAGTSSISRAISAQLSR